MNTAWKELKTILDVAAAKTAGMEIMWQDEHQSECWNHWHGYVWDSNYKYRARPRNPAEHELKTDSHVFDDVLDGRKTFEIRKDDRGFKVGDTLKLRKTLRTGAEMKKGFPLEYVGQPIYVYVTYILRGPIYGLAEGWVIMGISPRDGYADSKPAMKKVKSLCWRNGQSGALHWGDALLSPQKPWVRFPAGDIEGEVEA